MSFDGTGGRGLQDLFGLLRGLGAAGPDPNDDPIAQAPADIARRARLPKVGGLFGGDYGRPTEFLGWDEATRRYNGGGDPRYMEKVGKAYRDIKQGR